MDEDGIMKQKEVNRLGSYFYDADRHGWPILGDIVFAIAVKVIILALVAAGFANMWAAVFADVGVAVIAILNAMRTLYYKPQK